MAIGLPPVACRSRAAEPVAAGGTSPASLEPSGRSIPPHELAEAGGASGWRYPPAARLVAIGDLHGDLEATRDALRLAGAIDASEEWVGGTLVVVQTGDQLDRGNEEREVLALLDRVAAAARHKGGALHRLSGNHEVMNVQGDFRYVSPAGLAAYANASAAGESDPRLDRFPADVRGRARAFLPGGEVALRLAEQPIVLVVGDSLFVHGGLGEAHLEYGITRLNREAREFMVGAGGEPAILSGEGSPVWTRRFSAGTGASDFCPEVARVTAALGVARMVVGHTVQQKGITSACSGKVWRIDVGLAAYYGAARAVLEITPAGVRPITDE